jgi:hypothetical protein
VKEVLAGEEIPGRQGSHLVLQNIGQAACEVEDLLFLGGS